MITDDFAFCDAEGALANNLVNLGQGLRALVNSLGGEWKNTVVVVVSEFGRMFGKTAATARITDTAPCIACREADVGLI